MSIHHEHHTPKCKALLAQLGDYIDGELEAALCTEIEQHLADCDNCRVLVDTTRKTVLLYRQHSRHSQVELSKEITNRLWRALEDEGCVAPSD